MKTTTSQTNSIFHQPLGRLLLAVFCAASLWLTIQVSLTIGQSSQPKVEVVFISINHGDSILLRSSKGENVLIDAGYPEAGTLAYLQAHNINHLNAVIATHAHEDHIGG